MGMTYLIGEMLALLAVAGLVGFLVGWGFQRAVGGRDESRERELSYQIRRLENERNGLREQLAERESVGLDGGRGGAPGAAAAVAAFAAEPAAAPRSPEVPIDVRPQRGDAPVADLPGVGDNALHLMREVGIRTTRDLLRESEGEAKLRLLATALEEDTDTVIEWRAMADLMRVPGLDGPHARALVSLGVGGIEALNDRDADELYQRLRDVDSQVPIGVALADKLSVAGWISYASPMSQLDLDG